MKKEKENIGMETNMDSRSLILGNRFVPLPGTRGLLIRAKPIIMTAS